MFRRFIRNGSKLTATALSVTLLAVVFWLPTLGGATQVIPFPDFVVQTLDGSAVHSSAWPLQGKWLVIYVEPRCQPCVSLLGRLTKQNFPQLASWTLIIGGGMRPEEVAGLQKRFPDLGAAQWFVDPARNSLAALKLQGAPATFGVQNRNIQWTISGMLSDPQHFQSALNTWCAQ